MANHYFRTRDCSGTDYGKQSVQFVLAKIKSIAPLYFITFGIDFIIYYVLMVVQDSTLSKFGTLMNLMIQSIPEFLTIQMCGIRPIGVNSITWYLSAMFLAMLPLYYLMKKKPDFFFYIFSPLAALSLYAYFYHSGEPFFDQNSFNYLFTGGFLRACCGICFGVIAYLIGMKLRNLAVSKNRQIFLTICEVLLTVWFLYVWFQETLDCTILYPVSLLFPIILGIIFSGKSYVGKLFQFNGLRYCGSWSTWLYLNHYAAKKIMDETALLSHANYWMRYLAMGILTLLSCLICFALKKMIQFLVEQKRRHAKPDSLSCKSL